MMVVGLCAPRRIKHHTLMPHTHGDEVKLETIRLSPSPYQTTKQFQKFVTYDRNFFKSAVSILQKNSWKFAVRHDKSNKTVKWIWNLLRHHQFNLLVRFKHASRTNQVLKIYKWCYYSWKSTSTAIKKELIQSAHTRTKIRILNLFTEYNPSFPKPTSFMSRNSAGIN